MEHNNPLTSDEYPQANSYSEYMSSVLLTWQEYFKHLHTNNMAVVKTLSDLNQKFFKSFSTNNSSSSFEKESHSKL